MSYIDNTELLQELRQADQELREVQSDVRASTDSPLTRRIADHMHKWEEVLATTLDKIEEDMDKNTAETFNQATPHGSPSERLREHLPAPKDPKELATWTIQWHEELAEWCQTIGDQAISEKTADLFRKLAERLREVNRQLAADTRSLEQS